MNNADRVIWNSIVLYSKIIICIVLSLWCVPIILRALGVNDFGLYNLIAGLVAMLAFLKTAMTSSTQRYLSIQRGKGDAQELLSVYNISLLVHWIIACAILILGFALEPWLFNGFLNIEPTRINAAKIIYICLLISTIFTIVAIPYDATLNAYENMPVFAAIEILDQLLRLGLALSLLHINIDRLIFYGVGMASIQVMNFMVKWAYTHYKYKHLYLSLSLFKNPILFRQMFSFASSKRD